MLCRIDLVAVTISIGDKQFDWVANSVGPVKKQTPRPPACLPDGQPDLDRPYYFLGWPADVPSGFRAAKIRQAVHSGPALPREQIVALGRRRAALQVPRPAGPEACEHDHRNSIVTVDSAATRNLYFVSRGRNIF